MVELRLSCCPFKPNGRKKPPPDRRSNVTYAIVASMLLISSLPPIMVCGAVDRHGRFSVPLPYLQALASLQGGFVSRLSNPFHDVDNKSLTSKDTTMVDEAGGEPVTPSSIIFNITVLLGFRFAYLLGFGFAYLLTRRGVWYRLLLFSMCDIDWIVAKLETRKEEFGWLGVVEALAGTLYFALANIDLALE
ncbi:hypothetical protein Tco_1465688 [Tanacetum coccineum]